MTASFAGCGGGDEKIEVEILRFEDTLTALTELVNGGVDAVVADSPVVLEYIKNNPQSNLRSFGDPGFEKEYYGIAMRQEDEEKDKDSFMVSRPSPMVALITPSSTPKRGSSRLLTVTINGTRTTESPVINPALEAEV